MPGHPARHALADDVRHTPGARIRETLVTMGIKDARRAAVFVPPDNLTFWTIAMECRQDPLFVPAVLGVPMLKGMNPPELKCPREPYYGFSDYQDAHSEPLSDQQLCARAAHWDIDTVFILQTITSARKLRCGELAQPR
jgi:hypothetical protein